MLYHNQIDFIRKFDRRINGEKPQARALLFANRINPPYPVVCYEGKGGFRKYYVGSWRELFKYIFGPETPPDERNFYELIVTKRPVKLYIDAEWYPDSNPGICFDKFCDDIEVLVLECLLELFPEIKPALANATFFWYDAPTSPNAKEKKLSYHMTYHIPGYAFESAQACGRIILMMLFKAKQRNLPGFFATFPRENGSIFKEVIDLSVYKRNQNFRMHGSTKYKAGRWLLSPERRKLIAIDKEKALTFEYNKDYMEFFNGCCTHFFPDELETHKVLQVKLMSLGKDYTEMIKWISELGRAKSIMEDELGLGRWIINSNKLGTDDMATSETPEQIMAVINEILPNAGLSSIAYKDHPGYAMVTSYSKRCFIKASRGEGDFHKSNHVWFEFRVGPNAHNRGWRQRCHNDQCKLTPTEYYLFTPEENAMIDHYWDTRQRVMISINNLLSYMDPAITEALIEDDSNRPSLKRSRNDDTSNSQFTGYGSDTDTNHSYAKYPREDETSQSMVLNFESDIENDFSRDNTM